MVNDLLGREAVQSCDRKAALVFFLSKYRDAPASCISSFSDTNLGSNANVAME